MHDVTNTVCIHVQWCASSRITQHASSFVAEFFYHLSYTLNSKKKGFQILKLHLQHPFLLIYTDAEHNKYQRKAA